MSERPHHILKSDCNMRKWTIKTQCLINDNLRILSKNLKEEKNAKI